jgi:hypothetical protein
LNDLAYELDIMIAAAPRSVMLYLSKTDGARGAGSTTASMTVRLLNIDNNVCLTHTECPMAYP